MISNSLDIDFIHGDIHGRSCKKEAYFTYLFSEMELSLIPIHIHVNTWGLFS